MEATHADMPLGLRNSLPHSQAMDSLLTVLDVLDTQVLIVDQESRIRFFNPAYLEAYEAPLARVGIPRERLLGLPLVSLPDSAREWDLFQRIMKSGKPLRKYYFQDDDSHYSGLADLVPIVTDVFSGLMILQQESEKLRALSREISHWPCPGRSATTRTWPPASRRSWTPRTICPPGSGRSPASPSPL